MIRKQNEPTPEQMQTVSRKVRRDEDRIVSALRWSAVVLLGLMGCGTAVAAWFVWRRPEPERHEVVVALPQQRPESPRTPPKTPFTDITKAAGIDFVHCSGATGQKLLPETMGSGCAFFDFDSDDDPDILLVNGCPWPWDRVERESLPTMRLYRNDGEARFHDVTTEMGLAIPFYGTGVATGDYDNDGDADIYITAVGANRLFRNDGSRFVDVTKQAGVAGGEHTWSTSAAMFDYDNDGLLDLFVTNYVRWSREIDLAQDFQLVGVGRAYGPPMSFEGEFAQLFHNEGGGVFRDVSEEAGVRVRNPITGVPAAKSLGLVPVDIDDDGWLDVIVANDTVPNFLLHNLCDGTFEEVGMLAGIAFDESGTARGAMGIDAARFRNDRSLGVAIGNFANEMTALYVSDDDPLSFVDAAVATGLGPITRLRLTFGVFFFDYDLDGRLDLFAANGHLEREINKVQASQSYAQPAHLFWNAGPDAPTEFFPVTREYCGDDLLKPTVGRAAAYADIDGDGDLDVLLTSVGESPRLLRNDQQLGHHWIRFQLEGRSCNRDAIGAEVKVTLGDQVMRRTVVPTRSYLSQCELPVTFGLGRATEIDAVQVRWPGGEWQDVELWKVDALNRLSQ